MHYDNNTKNNIIKLIVINTLVENELWNAITSNKLLKSHLKFKEISLAKTLDYFTVACNSV